MRKLPLGSRVRGVSLGCWSCGLPVPQRGSRGTHIWTLFLISFHSPPSVSHWLNPVRSQKARELQRCIPQRPVLGHRANWTGMDSASGGANRVWSIYSMLPAWVCVFPSAPNAYLTLIPVPCCLANVQNSALNHQHSCLGFQFTWQPMHSLVTAESTWHCNCLFTCLPD